MRAFLDECEVQKQSFDACGKIATLPDPSGRIRVQAKDKR